MSKKTSQHLLNHKACGQGIRVSSFNICMLYPIRIVTWQLAVRVYLSDRQCCQMVVT